MPAQTTALDGIYSRLRISEDSGTTWKTAGYQTGNSLSSSFDLREIGGLGDCNTRKVRKGKLSQDISLDALLQDAGAPDSGETLIYPNELYQLHVDGTEVDIELTQIDCSGAEMVGEYKYTGKAVISSFDRQASDGDNQTMSLTLSVNGKLAVAAIA